MADNNTNNKKENNAFKLFDGDKNAPENRAEMKKYAPKEENSLGESIISKPKKKPAVPLTNKPIRPNKASAKHETDITDNTNLIVDAVFTDEKMTRIDVKGESGSESFVISNGRLKRLSSPVTEGMNVSRELYDEMDYLSRLTSCVAAAAVMVSSSSKSAKELKRRLINAKGYSEDIVDETIEFFISRGYINDTKQCESLALSAVKNKLHGKTRIRSDLYAKGYAEEAIKEAIESIDDDIFHYALEKFMKKAYAKYRGSEIGMKERKKLISSAVRYGYSASEANEVLKQIIKNDI